uniref:DDE-1 domain-containing protein n=1 Tax=Amphimedon queenslandica TaxID=400682 RepID=A0A1X7VHW7_AMPQE
MYKVYSGSRRCLERMFSGSYANVHEYTINGNLKPPSRTLLCQWVKSALDAVPIETVKKSFISCAITAPLDGKDEDKIHCFKPNQPCNGGRAKLQEEMDRFLNYNDESEEDPFPSDEDEEETENNETLIDNCDDDRCEETSDNDVYTTDDTE